MKLNFTPTSNTELPVYHPSEIIILIILVKNMRLTDMAPNHALRMLKHGLYSLLINLKSFFFLAYPMLQLLCGLGVGMGILLNFTASDIQENSYLVGLAFIGLSLLLYLQKKYYQQLIAWSAPRKNNVVSISNHSVQS